MTPAEVAATLRQFNGWRRDFDDKFEQPDPHEVSEAIDAAVEMIDRLEAAEKERDNANAAAAGVALHAGAMQDSLEAAEKSDAESLAMYRRARDERDALRAKLEAAESDAAHQKALADSALRVANGWERKCDELRAKVEQMEKQEPVAEIVSFGSSDLKEVAWKKGKMPALGSKLYAIPGAQPAPSVPNTYAAGINAVAAMLQSKADEYAKEHGHDDMGGLSFGPGMGGEIKMDYYTNLVELVDDVRAMLAAAPEASRAT